MVDSSGAGAAATASGAVTDTPDHELDPNPFTQVMSETVRPWRVLGCIAIVVAVVVFTIALPVTGGMVPVAGMYRTTNPCSLANRADPR